VGNGLIRWALGNKQTYPDAHLEASRLFENLFGARVLGSIPIVVVILLGMVVTGQLVLTKTKFGEQLRLVGASYDVAKMTGINVRFRTLQAFALSAAAASVGGILLASLNKLGADYIGKGYDFKTVTAIVIGGVSLAGGRGNMVGVLGGVLAIGLLENVLSLNGVSVDFQEVVKGTVFIAAVGTAAYLARRQGGDDV
jgi:ribose/xylose/arabinose/galactoside ABC-type transport system permease subunit